MSASPTAALAFTEMMRDIDVRHVLATIGAPTLVLHAVGDQVIEAARGRYMAARIPNARFVELPSDDHLPWLSDGHRDPERDARQCGTSHRVSTRAANHAVMAGTARLFCV